MSIVESIKSKGKSFIIAAAGAVLALVAMILAAVTTANDGKADAAIIVLSIIAVIGAFVTLFIDYRGFGKIAVAFLYLCCMGLFVSTQLGNLGYALYGITDIGNGVQPGFIAGVILYVLATVLAAITVFLKTDKKN